jgi:hypothetical protein
MQVQLRNPTPHNPSPVSVRCPYCDQLGSFDTLPTVSDISNGQNAVGVRRCPNVQCKSAIFIVLRGLDEVIEQFPAVPTSFDFTNIPDRIAESFRQALECKSHQLNVASAIMIRRTLEELCQDKGATGQNLKKRIESLQSNVVLPKALFDALDDLRLLGNDAAHVEASTFDKIGTAELDAAIDLTKEILKAVYQLESLLSKLRALRKDV